MDFTIMIYDWNMPMTEINLLTEKIEELRGIATVDEEENRHLKWKDRNKLTYGRCYITNGVSSYEYVKASFGGSLPIGLYDVVIASLGQEDACHSLSTGVHDCHIYKFKYLT